MYTYIILIVPHLQTNKQKDDYSPIPSLYEITKKRFIFLKLEDEKKKYC